MTCRKAKSWLDRNGISYEYRDILKQPLLASEYRELAARARRAPLELVNTKSTGYRLMAVKPSDDEAAVAALLANPKVMIRPVLASATEVQAGFDEAGFQQLVSKLGQ